MAKRPQLDLAAAMAADLQAHDPMSTKVSEPKSAADHGLKADPMEQSAHAPMGSVSEADVPNAPGRMAADEPMGSAPHEPMSQSDHGIMRQERPAGDPARRSYVPPSRSGMKRVQGYFSPRVKRQLRILAINTETSEEDLVARALNLLFAAEGLPAIAFDGKEKGRGGHGGS